MFRKVAFFGLAAMTAASLFVGTADARATRVKGKFKVADSGSPVLGSAKIRPMGGGVWLADLTLQHVRRSDYQLWVDVFADLNGDEQVDAGEQRGAVHFATCDLSRPTKKGHAGCHSDADIGAGNTPYAARLVPDQSAGDAPSAIAYLKR